MVTDIPTVAIKIMDWRIAGIYREWALQGDPETKSKELQVKRFESFVAAWQKITTKSIILGDFNFDPLPNTEYQKGLECVRTLVNDEILPSGWRQLVRGVTRTEVRKDKVITGQLDHIYVNTVDRVVKTWNQNVAASDHNMVGARVKMKGKIFRQETIKIRPLKNVTEEMFKEAWDAGVPDDIYLEKNPTKAFEILEYKIH